MNNWKEWVLWIAIFAVVAVVVTWSAIESEKWRARIHYQEFKRLQAEEVK